MNKKELSPEEQARIEAEFLRSEAERERAEKRAKKIRTRKVLADLPYEAIWATWIFSAGFILYEIFVLRNLHPTLVILVAWMAVISWCVARTRRIALEGSAEQISDGDAEKPPGVERES